MTQSTALVEVKTARALLESATPQFTVVLPRNIDVERFKQVALNCCSQNPKLLRCTKRSFCQAVMDAAALGLEPNGVLGLGYIIPYGEEAKFQPGYKGLIRLLMETGEFSDIFAEEVYRHDEFSYRSGFVRDLVYIPNWDGDRSPASMRLVYSVVTRTSGDKSPCVMTRAEVDKIRDISKAYKADPTGSPWAHFYVEMAKKTVIKRHMKYLNISSKRWDLAMELEQDSVGIDTPRSSPIRRVEIIPASQEVAEEPEPWSAPALPPASPAPARPEPASGKKRGPGRPRKADTTPPPPPPPPSSPPEPEVASGEAQGAALVTEALQQPDLLTVPPSRPRRPLTPRQEGLVIRCKQIMAAIETHPRGGVDLVNTFLANPPEDLAINPDFLQKKINQLEHEYAGLLEAEKQDGVAESEFEAHPF